MASLSFLVIALVNASVVLPALAQPHLQPLRDLSRHAVDEPQLRSAVASRTLTWLTGSSANNDYVSVGRLANFFGFVALRVSSGQSLTRAHVARDTLANLDDTQRVALAETLGDQITAYEQTRRARIAMNRALERLLVGEVVTRDEFLALGRAYGAAEAEMGRVIAQSFGEIAQTLTPEQTEALVLVRSAHAAGQPDLVPEPQGAVRLPDVDRQELVNLAARFLSWTTGSPEYNDFEVVGKPSQHFGFVSLRLASGHSVRRGAVAQEVLEILSPEQHQMLDQAVAQNVGAFDDFLSSRALLMRALEVALDGGVIDVADVASFGASIGEIEAEMTWAQASAMLNVRNNLTEAQSAALIAIRSNYAPALPENRPDDPVVLGRQLFAQCALCHVNAGNGVAPSLTGVLGRDIAQEPGYDLYSPSMRAYAETNGAWSPELLDRFLTSPRAAVPGTSMGFDGLSSASDRAALLEYLGTLE